MLVFKSRIRCLLLTSTWLLFTAPACGDDDPQAGDPCSGDRCTGEGSNYLSCGGDGKWRRVTDPACECNDGKETCQ